MSESDVVLELKEQNKKLKNKLKEKNALLGNHDHQTLENKNMILETLHHVWCSGGCEGGVRGEEITSEMVAYALEYANRLSKWYIAREGNKMIKEKCDTGEYWSQTREERHEEYEKVWGDARTAITFARKKFMDL